MKTKDIISWTGLSIFSVLVILSFWWDIFIIIAITLLLIFGIIAMMKDQLDKDDELRELREKVEKLEGDQDG